jgi:hypothetical protein
MYRKETPEEELDNLWMDVQALEMERNDLLRELGSPWLIRHVQTEADITALIEKAKHGMQHLRAKQVLALDEFTSAWRKASYDSRRTVSNHIGVVPEDMANHLDNLRATFEDEPDWDMAIMLLISWLGSRLPKDDPAFNDPAIWADETNVPTHPEPVRREDRALAAVMFLVVVLVMLISIFKKPLPPMPSSPSSN